MLSRRFYLLYKTEKGRHEEIQRDTQRDEESCFLVSFIYGNRMYALFYKQIYSFAKGILSWARGTSSILYIRYIIYIIVFYVAYLRESLGSPKLFFF